MVSGTSIAGMSQYADDTVRDFLQNRMDSLVKWDLVRFFHDNPHTRDTAENIAQYTGRNASDIVRDLNGLVSAGVLQADTIDGLVIYRLTDDERTRFTINRFMEACHDRAFRMKVIHHVIQRTQTKHQQRI